MQLYTLYKASSIGGLNSVPFGEKLKIMKRFNIHVIHFETFVSLISLQRELLRASNFFKLLKIFLLQTLDIGFLKRLKHRRWASWTTQTLHFLVTQFSMCAFSASTRLLNVLGSTPHASEQINEIGNFFYNSNTFSSFVSSKSFQL